MSIKSLKIHKAQKSLVVVSCRVYRVKGTDGSTAELAFTTPNEVLFIDAGGTLSWGGRDYLEEKFDILEDMTEKVSIEVEE